MLPRLTTLVLLITSTVSQVQALSSPSWSLPTINLGYVILQGSVNTSSVGANVHFFGGIPYAKPPLGELRFKAPRNFNEKPRDDPPVVDASEFGPACIQQPASVGTGSEDCLLLNVWKPAKAEEGDKLAVIVYFYGGGFVAGSTQSAPMANWVNQVPNVIAVTVGYRLNMFGFLSTPDMDPQDLNAGLLDQRVALEWIQRHISKFGGDPDTVTIDGESAGGASTLMQVVAFGGQRIVPFKRAISQSIGWGPMPTEEQRAAAFANVTTTVNCPPTGQASLGCLRNASLDALIPAVNSFQAGKLSPIVSGPGTILPDAPSSLIRSGRFAKVDYIGGHCTNDGTAFTNGTPSTIVTEALVVAAVLNRWPSLSNKTISKMLELYPSPDEPGSPFASQYERAWVIEQDVVFACMDFFLSNRTATLSNNQKSTFTFRFNAPNPFAFAAAPYQGVTHGSDVYFMFPSLSPYNATELALSQELIAYWTSFARTGDPSKLKESFSPKWEGQPAGERVVMTRSDTANITASTVEKISAYEVERCLFWMSEEVTKETLL